MTKRSPRQIAVATQPRETGGSGAWAFVQRVGSHSADIRVDLSDIERGDHTLAVDCATAMLRFGEPELHFGCLSADSKRLTRVVVARYERSRFVDRAEINDEFRKTVDANVARPHETPPGYFSDLYQNAQTTDQLLTVDVELEVVSHVGTTAGMVLVSASNLHMSYAAQGKRSRFSLRPDIDLTMRVHVLTDLLRSWQALRVEMGAL